ncbi:MAG TPA: hypothetical protein VEA37_13845 [Flavobacterium sp.]|nr:hypothetical protein [Flavobacterium sp.]
MFGFHLEIKLLEGEVASTSTGIARCGRYTALTCIRYGEGKTVSNVIESNDEIQPQLEKGTQVVVKELQLWFRSFQILACALKVRPAN